MKPNNYVADYRVTIEACDRCGGTGRIVIQDKEQFKEYVSSLDDVLSLNELRELYELYLKYGELDCNVCNGRGSIERWV